MVKRDVDVCRLSDSRPVGILTGSLERENTSVFVKVYAHVPLPVLEDHTESFLHSTTLIVQL
jgi:hypothetical protein